MSDNTTLNPNDSRSKRPGYHSNPVLKRFPTESFVSRIQNIDFVEKYLVFFFRPSRAMPGLRLYNNHSDSRGGGIVIQRPSLFIIAERFGKHNHIFVGDGSISGYAMLDTLIDDKKHFIYKDSVYRYEIWQGNNSFFGNGAIMLGPDFNTLVGTVIFIIVPSVLFYIAILVPFQTFLSVKIIITIALALIELFCLCNLFLAAITDPGIIPRIPKWKTAQMPPQAVGQQPSKHSNWKYCETCNVYRPPRSKHCAFCQNCIESFDHHCPYVGTCLGKRNYKYFLRFVVSLTIFVITALAISVCYFVDVVKDSSRPKTVNNIFRILTSKPVAFAVVVIAFLAIWYLNLLCGYHMYLLSIGQTTNEHLKRVYRDDLNPNNHGCCTNTAVICSETQPSKLPVMSVKLSAQQYIREAVPQDLESSSSNHATDKLSRNAWTVVSHRHRDSLENEVKNNEDDDEGDSDESSVGSFDANQDEETIHKTKANTAINNPMLSERS